MITKESVLYHLPGNLSPTQALFFDGIRHAAQMADFAYRRLQNTLTKIAQEGNEQTPDSAYTPAFLDAWALVDVIDRFRTLAAAVPGQRPRDASDSEQRLGEFLQPVRDLRNVADHLAQRAQYVVAHNGSALGELSWVTMLGPDQGVTCLIVPGTIRGRTMTFINPVDKQIEYPTGLIHLAIGNHKANLSEVMPRIASGIRKLEAGLEASFAQQGITGTAGADLLMKLLFESRPAP